MVANILTRRILAVKLADLGDVLLCEPALRSLRLAYPDARIDVLVPPSSAGVLDLIGHDVNPVMFPKQYFDSATKAATAANARRAASLATKLRREHYDVVLLFHHLSTRLGAIKFRALVAATNAKIIVGLDNGRGKFLTHGVLDRGFGAMHESEYMLAIARAAGGADTDPRPRVIADAVDHQLAPKGRYAAIFPATGPYSLARTWPVDRYVDVALDLQQAGMSIVIVGASDAQPAADIVRRDVPGIIDMTGGTTLSQLAGVLSRASVVVGPDSFIGHLAAALDRPVVSIFGPSNADAWRPYASPDRCVVARTGLPCEPCIYTGYSLGRRDGCPSRTCLDLVTPGHVISAIRLVEKAA